jgi:UDP:flavonoid glycosyltransferase YjiC (YdhE family)
MTTFAFFNLPARGHINPTLPIVKQLVSERATVHYFVGEEYRELVERAGSRFHPLPPLKRFEDQLALRPSVPDDKQIALMPLSMAYQAPHTDPQLVKVLRV